MHSNMPASWINGAGNVGFLVAVVISCKAQMCRLSIKSTHANVMDQWCWHSLGGALEAWGGS